MRACCALPVQRLWLETDLLETSRSACRRCRQGSPGHRLWGRTLGRRCWTIGFDIHEDSRRLPVVTAFGALAPPWPGVQQMRANLSTARARQPRAMARQQRRKKGARRAPLLVVSHQNRPQRRLIRSGPKVLGHRHDLDAVDVDVGRAARSRAYGIGDILGWMACPLDRRWLPWHRPVEAQCWRTRCRRTGWLHVGDTRMAVPARSARRLRLNCFNERLGGAVDVATRIGVGAGDGADIDDVARLRATMPAAASG